MVMSWQYIAGFFDGEGSIGTGVHSTGRQATAYIAQSGPVGLLTLRRISEFLTENGIKNSVFESGKAGKHLRTMPSYRLALCGYTSVVKFLTALFPYLYIKKTFAQDILRYHKLYPSIQTSPLAAAYRSERQRANAPRGEEWRARNVVNRIGRPRKFAANCKTEAKVTRWL